MKMMRICLIFILMIFGIPTNAQESFIEYHENGKVALQGSKVNGAWVGERATFYEDGAVKAISRYNSGYLVQKKEYYNSGELMNTSYFIDGTEFFKVFHYYKNGQLEKEGKIDRSGLESGEWLYYSEDNQFIRMVIFEKGKVVS